MPTFQAKLEVNETRLRSKSNEGLGAVTHWNFRNKPALTSQPATPKSGHNCNNQGLTCYALVTHNQSHPACKCLLEAELQKFVELLGRSSKRLSLGRQNREFCGKARKSHPSVTPKTPVCVTHILRTPAPFPHAGWKVAGQTQKAGVMHVLCTPFHGIWTDLDPGANVWPR
jgi:hypothetical protein